MYDVSVDGKPLDVYRVWINARNAYNRYRDDENRAAMAYFDFSGTVRVEITVKFADVNSYVLYPTRHAIASERAGNRITFLLDGPPKQLVLKVNGDWRHCLHLFANPLETDAPDPRSQGVRYFGPGVHLPADDGVPGLIRLRSNETIYIAGGAVVRGFIHKLDDEPVKNAVIRGHGILNSRVPEDPWGNRYRDMISLWRASDTTVRDVILLNHWDNQQIQFAMRIYWCDNITVDNVKYIGSNKCSDGANIGSCENVRVTRSFFRGFDDILCIKGFADTPGIDRGGFDDKQGGTIPMSGGANGVRSDKITRNVWYEDCIAVCDKAGWNGNALNMAWQAFTPLITKCGYRRIDVIRAGGHTLRIQPEWVSNPKTVYDNILVDDVRVEEPPATRHFRIEAKEQAGRGDVQGKAPTAIRNVTIRAFHAFDRSARRRSRASDIEGNVSNVTFENLIINGRRIENRQQAVDPAVGGFRIDPGVSVEFK